MPTPSNVGMLGPEDSLAVTRIIDYQGAEHGQPKPSPTVKRRRLQSLCLLLSYP